ncbi:MAG: BNR-4 repeat-containing protein [Victivallales bacterium]|nr:BNR-4 repeat-containing protein [Victivallales bacterium]
MINLDKCRELRIKRANTDWWINEKAIVGENGKTYIAYMTDMGEIHLKELDAKCSRAPSRDITLRRLNCNYADEHNSPSLCILQDGRMIVAYTGHAATATLTYRITERPYDIFSFGPEIVLEYDSSVTYAQLFENTARHELWLFTRVAGVTWEFRYSKDAIHWSKPTCFLASDAGGLFYFNVRKQLIPSKKGLCERWFFALYGHPRISKDHTIRSGIFDSDGWLLTMDGERTNMNLYGNKLGEDGKLTVNQLDLQNLSVVYDSPEGTTVRLLEVAPTVPLRVGLATFELNKPETITYYIASWKDNVWRLSKPIAHGGEFLSKPPQLDGSQTYVGGMACYYGVGEDGFHPKHHDWCETNRVFIARADSESRLLESYVTHDNGITYELEQVIKSISHKENLKIWRPIVPIFAQDNLPVYWHEGTYSAHTGGWHCDAVMFVEYDD